MPASDHAPAVSLLRSALRVLWEILLCTLVAGLILATPVVLLLLGVIAFVRLNTTTVEWPHPEVVAMRERADQRFPPPPASSFDAATITTYVDGDQWKCVRYKTEASVADVRAHYTAIFREIGWGVSDGFGHDGPYIWQLSVVSMNGTVRLTPWDQWASAESAPPPYRVAVCFSYESWLWPKRVRTTTMLGWPHPAVVAWRERMEEAYPPDPSWSFRRAMITSYPSGWRTRCITYETGVSASEIRGYYAAYERWRRHGNPWGEPGEQYLGKSSVQATDGAVTLCPF